MSAVERSDQFMPEAEVTLRLAFWLLDHTDDSEHADIAVDGAHVRIKAHEQNGRAVAERIVIDIRSVLSAAGSQPVTLTDD
jgi:hypothetical protein